MTPATTRLIEFLDDLYFDNPTLFSLIDGVRAEADAPPIVHPLPDFGEPWRIDDRGWVVTRHGMPIGCGSLINRYIACIDACAGIRNPEAVKQLIQEFREDAKREDRKCFNYCPSYWAEQFDKEPVKP
jgi:hypothetical protein